MGEDFFGELGAFADYGVEWGCGVVDGVRGRGVVNVVVIVVMNGTSIYGCR